MEEISVRVVKSPPWGDVVRLYRDAGWWKPEYPETPAGVRGIVKGSLCFVGAFLGKRMIGMGRALSDGVGDAYIQDVTVLGEFRGRGVGARIVAAMLECLRARGIDWIGLIAAPGHAALYRKLGFRRMEGFMPMRWGGDE